MLRGANRRGTLALVLAAGLPLAARAEQSVSVGLFTGGTAASFSNTPTRVGPSATWTLQRGSFGVGAGLRAGLPASMPLEAFVRGFVTLPGELWAPLLGPELGAGGLSELTPVVGPQPVGVRPAEQQVLGVAYVAFHAEPARFIFGHVVVSALGFDVGTPLLAPGVSLRWQLDLLSVGWRW